MERGAPGAYLQAMSYRVLLLVSWALLGCDSAADVIARRRPAVEQSLARLARLEAKVRATPAVSESKVRAAPIVLERSEGGPPSNAAFVYAEDLADLAAPKPVHLRTLDSAPLLQCGALLAKGQYVGDAVTRPLPSVVEQHLAACERLRYALVIRLLQFTPPALALEVKKFAPGIYKAEVLVFDLEQGELLGGYLVTAMNEPSVRLLDGDGDHVQRLITNLESEVFSELRAATRKWIPGALPPAAK